MTDSPQTMQNQINELQQTTVETIDKIQVPENPRGSEFKPETLTDGMSGEEKQAFYIALEQKFKHKIQVIMDAKNRAKRRSPIHVKRAKNRAKNKAARKARQKNKSLG